MLARSQKAWLEYQSNYYAFMASAKEGGNIVRLIRPQCYANNAKPGCANSKFSLIARKVSSAASAITGRLDSAAGSGDTRPPLPSTGGARGGPKPAPSKQ